MSKAPCAFQHRATPNHSEDRVTVYGGSATPHTLCGYHATQWLPEFYQWLRATGREAATA